MFPNALREACGGCHAVPRPEAFTDRTWRGAIKYMYWLFDEFYPQAEGYLPESEALSYYLKNSAQQLPAPRLYPSVEPSDGTFVLKPFWGAEARTLIADFSVVKNDEGQPVLLTTDMLAGRIEETTLGSKNQTKIIGTASHPTAARRHDVDGDGRADDIVIELRTFSAKDIERGRVQVVRNQGHGRSSQSILDGAGRIADVAAGDMMSNGRLDLVVADFGWQKTGGLYLLTAATDHSKQLKFAKKTLDDRAGHIAAAVADMDGDGDLDIVSGLAQHHEQIELWTNTGSGRFKGKTLFKAHTPMWVLMTLQVVDLDGDGDMDILHVNGDTLDAPKLQVFKAYTSLKIVVQGIFQNRQLAELPGAHDIDVGDVNGDGRLDIVAVANLAPGLWETLWASNQKTPSTVPLESVLLLTQTKRLDFRVTSLLRQQSCFSAVALADLDGDGDLDITLGPFGIGWSLLGSYVSQKASKLPQRVCDQDQLWQLSNGRLGGVQLASLAKTPSTHQLERRLQALQIITEHDPRDVAYQLDLSNTLTETGRHGEDARY